MAAFLGAHDTAHKALKKEPNMIIRLISSLAVLIGFAGCSVIDDLVKTGDKAQITIEKAIGSLNKNSTDWQKIVGDLQQEIHQLPGEAANQVDAVARRTVNDARAQVQCTMEWLGDRVKEDLEAVLLRLQKKPVPPRTPRVCGIVFAPPQDEKATVNMASRPNEISYYGYNFDDVYEGNPEIVLQHSGGEISLKKYTNLAHHYLLTLKTAPQDGVPLCNLKDRKIVMKSRGETKYTLDVIEASCPNPIIIEPAAPESVPGFPITDKAEGNVAGFANIERTFGRKCDAWRRRSTFSVAVVERRGDDDKAKVFKEWKDGDPTNCEIKVSYALKASLNVHYLVTRIDIVQEGIPQDPIAQTCNCK